MSTTTTANPHRLIRRPEVRHKTGLGDTNIDNLEAKGDFPRRIKLSPRCIGWDEAEIDRWIKEKIAESRA